MEFASAFTEVEFVNVSGLEGKPVATRPVYRNPRRPIERHLRHGLCKRESMKRILIVDDNPLFRALLIGQLERAGYQALGAAEGQEAITLHRQHAADLVVCDLFM